MRFVLPIVLLALCGCAFRSPGYVTPGAEGITIIKPDMPGLEKLRSETLVVRFDRKQDGTKLIVDFLTEAQGKGAVYVSGLAIAIASVVGEKSVVCVTEIGPVEHVQSRTEPSYTPAKTSGAYVLKPVGKTVSEMEYQCTYVSRPVQEMETYYTTEYDYYLKQSRTVPRTRYVTRYRSQPECSYRSVTRHVTRYEYQYVTEYIPPKMEYITRTYSKWELRESEPICRESDAGTPDTISGTIYVTVP